MSAPALPIVTATVVLLTAGTTFYRLQTNLRPNATTSLDLSAVPFQHDTVITIDTHQQTAPDLSAHSTNRHDDSNLLPAPPQEVQVPKANVPITRPVLADQSPPDRPLNSVIPRRRRTRRPRRRPINTSPATTTTTSTTTTTTTERPTLFDFEGDYEFDSQPPPPPTRKPVFESLPKPVINVPPPIQQKPPSRDPNRSPAVEIPTGRNPLRDQNFIPKRSKRNLVRTRTGIYEGLITEVPIVGSISDVENSVVAFLGVPYARPPVGLLRFEKPQPLTSSRKYSRATRDPPVCPQDIDRLIEARVPLTYRNRDMSEDCLYLNIWTPSLSEPVDTGQSGFEDSIPSHTNSIGSLPVMVVIPGVQCSWGSIGAEELSGSLMASQGRMVVVNVAYRLGVLGFLDGGRNTSITRNLALHDMELALKWVNENIAGFGGDPKRITLFGIHPGAIMISAMMWNPRTRPLFARAIMADGSATIFFDSWYRASIISARKIAHLVGCALPPTVKRPPNTEAIDLDCMKAVPIQILKAASNKRLESMPFAWGLSIDGDFIPNEGALEAIKDPSRFNGKKELLIGASQAVGASFLDMLMPNIFQKNLQGIKLDLRKVAGNLDDFGFSVTNSDFYRDMFSILIDRVKNARVALEVMLDVAGDNGIICPAVYYAENYHQVTGSDIYFYFNTHRPSNTAPNRWYNATLYEDTPFVMGRPLVARQADYTQSDRDYSERLVKIWSNFVWTGSPGTVFGANWPKYSKANPTYVELNAKHGENMVTGRGPRFEDCELWKEGIKIFERIQKSRG